MSDEVPPKKITISSSAGGGVLLRLVVNEKVADTQEWQDSTVIKKELYEDDDYSNASVGKYFKDERQFDQSGTDWQDDVTSVVPAKFQGRNYRLQPNQYTKKYLDSCNEELGDGSYDPNYDWDSRVVITERGERAFACELCEHVTLHRMNLQEHMVWRHGQRSKFRCDVCFRYYPNSKSKAFREHLEMCSPTPLGPEELDLLKTLPCPYCNKKFRTVTYLNVHIKIVHRRIRKIQCPHCHFRTNKNSPLECHMIRKHGYHGDMQCNICDKQFHRSVSKIFEKHVMQCAHQMERRQFSCLECHMKFSKLLSLNNHMKVYHRSERFYCEHCNMHFSSNSMLVQHYLKRHGYETDTECPKCSAKFSAFDIPEFEQHVLECNVEDEAENAHVGEEGEVVCVGEEGEVGEYVGVEGESTDIGDEERVVEYDATPHQAEYDIVPVDGVV